MNAYYGFPLWAWLVLGACLWTFMCVAGIARSDNRNYGGGCIWLLVWVLGFWAVAFLLLGRWLA